MSEVAFEALCPKTGAIEGIFITVSSEVNRLSSILLFSLTMSLHCDIRSVIRVVVRMREE